MWDDEHIRSLIASVSLSYPIGAVMLLQTGGDGAQFQPRPVEGVTVDPGKKPDFLILDGQQRMTSLDLAFLSGKTVPTQTEKGLPIQRVDYLGIAKCLNPNEDRVEALLSLTAHRRITSDFGRKVELDLSSVEKEIETASELRSHGLLNGEIGVITDLQRRRWPEKIAAVIEAVVGENRERICSSV